MTTAASFTAFALPDVPLIAEGHDIAGEIIAGYARAGEPMAADDIIVISSKIISKAEGRRVRVDSVTPDEDAYHYAEITTKDPRMVQLILSESVEVSRAAKNVLVVAHRLGFVSANAGIDQSNVGEEGVVLLLPVDPDGTAQQLREALKQRTGTAPAIIISDTHGRPFRMGNVGVAIGVAGMNALLDLRGEVDLYGRELMHSSQAYADLAASAAHLLCGEAGEGRPIVVLRGLDFPRGEGRASDLNRPPETDLYRR